jgi:serine protease
MPAPHDQQHHDVPQRHGGVSGDGMSGSVILRLSHDPDPGDGPELRAHAEERQLSSLVRFLDELEQPPTRRVITTVEPGKLLRLEEQVRGSSRPPFDSLTRYWRIDARELGQPLRGLAKRFSQLDGVELAYAEMAVSDPAVARVRKVLLGDQGYLEAAPIGIDARWAKTQPGGRGQYADVCDIEQSWRLEHEDLRDNRPTLIPDPHGRLVNQDRIGGHIGHHGTAVMGLIAAVENGFGVLGVAPSLRSLRASAIYDRTDGTQHVADALTLAWTSMSPGDVLLLEVQRGPSGAELPTEIDHTDFLAIQEATMHGVIVVEAAGNGDRYVDTELQRVNGAVDPGAIMVGACQSALVDEMSDRRHARTLTSNYGRRVDCHAWGENVTTCGGADAMPETSYRHDFGGTSSAAAIIAGAAVLIQSMYRAPRMKDYPDARLSPAQVRNFLSNLAAGTSQSPSRPGYIGPMPNLQLIKTKLLDRLPRGVTDVTADPGNP